MRYYGGGIFPELYVEEIQRIRSKHDPTFELIEPHIGVLFPVPETVGEEKLVDHLRRVLGDWRPFEIRLDGFQKTDDHWLLLTLEEGDEEVRRMYADVYSGPLEEHRAQDIDFVPHVGLGLFLREGTRYKMLRPEAADFDAESYASALREAEEVRFERSELVTELRLLIFPGEVMEWAVGQRPDLPRHLRSQQVETLQLGG